MEILAHWHDWSIPHVGDIFITEQQTQVPDPNVGYAIEYANWPPLGANLGVLGFGEAKQIQEVRLVEVGPSPLNFRIRIYALLRRLKLQTAGDVSA